MSHPHTHHALPFALNIAGAQDSHHLNRRLEEYATAELPTHFTGLVRFMIVTWSNSSNAMSAAFDIADGIEDASDDLNLRQHGSPTICTASIVSDDLINQTLHNLNDKTFPNRREFSLGHQNLLNTYALGTADVRIFLFDRTDTTCQHSVISTYVNAIQQAPASPFPAIGIDLVDPEHDEGSFAQYLRQANITSYALPPIIRMALRAKALRGPTLFILGGLIRDIAMKHFHRITSQPLHASNN